MSAFHGLLLWTLGLAGINVILLVGFVYDESQVRGLLLVMLFLTVPFTFFVGGLCYRAWKKGI